MHIWQKKSVFVLLFGFGFFSCGPEDDMRTSVLKIGVANLEITPENHGRYYPLEGYGAEETARFRELLYVSRDPVNGVHDPMTARCLIIDDGNEKLVFITADLAFGFAIYPLFYPYSLMEEALEKTGIHPDNVSVSVSHTHSAPSVTMTKEYEEYVFKILGKLITEANSDLQSARVYYNKGAVTRKTVNRRNPERPPDGTVMTMRFVGDDGRSIASVLNFACHPVFLGPDNNRISADFVHYLRKRMEEEYGGTALFFNRHAGDINPPGGWDRTGGMFMKAEEFGVTLANEIIAMQSLDHPGKIRIKVKHSREKGIDLSVISLGEAQIITIPGESLSGFGKQIDDILPGPYKFFFSYTNGHEGYIVPESEWGKCTSSFMRECYEETRSRRNLAETMTRMYREMAREVF